MLVKFVLAMYVAFVLAAPNRYIPSPQLRHAYSIIIGALLLQFTFGGSWLHLLIASSVVYFINAATLHVRAFNQWRHWVAALFAFAYLTAMHYFRLFTKVEAASIDYMIVQMVLIPKVYSFSYNLMDGVVDGARNKSRVQQLDEQLASSITEPERKRVSRERKVLVDRIERELTHIPSLLEYYGFIFNFCTVFVGPSFEISEYLSTQNRPLCPSDATRFRPALYKLLQAAFFMAVNFVISLRFSIDSIYSRAQDGTTPLWKALLSAHVALVGLRFGYYFVWRLAEASSVLAGYGRIEGSNWDGTMNVRCWEVESATSMSAVMRDWNIFTQSWLERYIFLRAPRIYEFNRWITFAASAFWHGLFPGYYMGFATVPVMASASRMAYGVMKPLITPHGYDKARIEYKLYTALKFVITHASFDYALVSFALYDIVRSVAVWKSWYYYGHLGAVALFLTMPLVQALFGRKGNALAAAEQQTSQQPALVALGEPTHGLPSPKPIPTPDPTADPSSHTEKSTGAREVGEEAGGSGPESSDSKRSGGGVRRRRVKSPRRT